MSDGIVIEPKRPKKPKQPEPQAMWNTKRVLYSWLCVAIVSGVCGFGSSLEYRNATIREERTAIHAWKDTFITNATYAGCGHKDQVGGFAFNAFPTAMDDNGEPIKPVKVRVRR